MARKGKRKRIREGIYIDGSGYSAIVQVGTQSREKRWPFGAPLEQLEQWRKDERYRLEQDQPKTPRGTLAADLKRYDKAIRDLVGYVTRRAEIRAWIAVLGKKKLRSRITPEDVRRVRGIWLRQKTVRKKVTAPKTINNRVFALQHLYRTLDGQHVRTPCDDIKPLAVHKRPAVRIPDDTIRQIYANLLEAERRGRLRDAKTRARFVVFASTGHRPSEIARALEADVDLARRVWTPRDGKGGFCPGVYLNDDMLEAWKIFIAADAWGVFDVSSFGERIRQNGLPPNVTPYQLRHTVGIAAAEMPDVDLQDVADHLGHKRVATTRTHYVPVINSRLQRLSEALGTRKLGWKAEDTSFKEQE